MSDLPANGVTNPYGRVHDTANCYVAGSALFPSTGPPNPMLSSAALIHRTADLLTTAVLPARHPGPQMLASGHLSRGPQHHSAAGAGSAPEPATGSL